jgi:hypothetical protein
VLSSVDRTASFIASDQTVDCYGEIVRAAGWKFDRFAKNAPFLDSHNYDTVTRLLGEVIGWKIAGAQLLEDVRFVPAGVNPVADIAWKLVESGFLKAVSVGFMPLKVRSRFRDQADFLAAAKELNVPDSLSMKLNAIHWEQEQTELSAVLIGANPSAVALAYRTGALDDEDMESVGFRTSADIEFLQQAANEWLNYDAAQRRRVTAELRQIFADSHPSQAQKRVPASDESDARLGFLAELHRVANGV